MVLPYDRSTLWFLVHIYSIKLGMSWVLVVYGLNKGTTLRPFYPMIPCTHLQHKVGHVMGASGVWVK